MINYEAFFKVSYGLYVVCSGDRTHGNGFVSNTVFQVTSEPPRFAASCNKNNYTASIIEESGAFSVSILMESASPEIIGRFGYQSGKDGDKMAGVALRYGETGVPILLNESIGFLECRVVQKVDAGTHIIFIGELVQAEVLDDSSEPLTYAGYRKTRKGLSPKNAPTYIDPSKLSAQKEKAAGKQFKCLACGYIYDEAVETVKFADLPEDWICPACGSEKSDFIEFQP